jgi:aspartyl-tRNA(Asn)/glutamyl-tRNA(Gln) amidotransferase subunit B
MKYDVIIGLEIHAELKTQSKMFCACQNNLSGQKANTAICPICLGHPGTLPMPNSQALEMILLLGLALNGEINQISKFDRKNYFYPDLPKGYQISQYDLPLIYNAALEVDDQNIAITRLHLEEDTGKLSHPAKANHTLIDFNRAGTPLIEMVTEPVIKSAEQAKKFCQKYQQILRYLNISDADMEKGQMRCEVNISLQKPGTWIYQNGQIEVLKNYNLNPKAEIKNINSFKAVERAINFEITRQSELLDQGQKVLPETRGWSDSQNITKSQRLKETSADYRYFPEPDIPPIEINQGLINEIKNRLIELPVAKTSRFIQEYGLKPELAETITADKALADWFEEAVSEIRAWIETGGDDWERQGQKLAATTANWLTSELLKYDRNKYPTPNDFAKLISLIYQDKINSSAGQEILKAMIKTKSDPLDLMKKMNLEQTDNSAELEKIIKQIIKLNPEQLAQYLKGKTGLIQFFVGQTMAKTHGKANPKKVLELLQKYLNQ